MSWLCRIVLETELYLSTKYLYARAEPFCRILILLVFVGERVILFSCFWYLRVFFLSASISCQGWMSCSLNPVVTWTVSVFIKVYSMVRQREGVLCGFNLIDAFLWRVSQFSKFLKQIILSQHLHFLYICYFTVFFKKNQMTGIKLKRKNKGWKLSSCGSKLHCYPLLMWNKRLTLPVQMTCRVC